MKTNADALKRTAELQNIPLRTVDDVRSDLKKAEKYGTAAQMASMMLRHGRLTADARAYVEGYLAGA